MGRLPGATRSPAGCGTKRAEAPRKGGGSPATMRWMASENDGRSGCSTAQHANALVFYSRRCSEHRGGPAPKQLLLRPISITVAT
jgi:hypothetical protein